MRTHKKAIRIIAFLLVIALCLTGCTPEIQEAVQEAWVEQFETVQKPQIIELWNTKVLGNDAKITYDPTEGTGAPAEQWFKSGSNPKITAEKPTRAGYHFVGWTRLEGSGEPQFFAGKKTLFSFTQDTTLYACWEAYNPEDPFAVQACRGQTVNIFGGQSNFTVQHTYHKISENDGTVVRITCDCGFELVDRDISQDTFVNLVSNGKYQTFSALKDSQKEEYAKDYLRYVNPGEETEKQLSQQTEPTESTPPTADTSVQEETKEPLPQQTEPTESTPPTADTSVQEGTKESSSWQDRFEDSKVSATVIPDEVEIRYHATGATNVPSPHVISFNKLFSSKRISDQCPVKPGYVFLGWGTTKDATEVAYQPGDKYDKRESVLLYAVWEACTHQNADGELYGLNFEIEKKTRCTRCNGEVPPGLYYFSDYVKTMKPWYVFWGWDYTNLSSEELNEALADYLARKEEGYKTVLDYLENHGMPTVPVPQETENILSDFIGGYKATKDQIEKYYNTVFSDKKMRDAIIPVSADRSDLDAFDEEVKPAYDTLEKVLSGTKAIQAMVSFGESCKKYDEEMLDGIINTYHIQMQKIACGIEFAEALNSLAGFLYSVAGATTVSVLMPDPADFHQMIETMKFNEVSCEIFDSLAFLNIPKNEETACIQAFSNLSVIEEDARGNKVIVYKTQEEDIQVQKTRWPNGPTAKQAFEYIQQLEKQRLIVPGWYFYLGWRMEHETMNIILMVLDDKI